MRLATFCSKTTAASIACARVVGPNLSLEVHQYVFSAEHLNGRLCFFAATPNVNLGISKAPERQLTGLEHEGLPQPEQSQHFKLM
jgi:hypothetical protein